ncbi:TIGR02452 family protein [Ligilactobacillus pobuzihii]|uniref:TIGR02452 family protein n=1 Tax=Ligilactobacillus pobuzihii TaxID=449659 RepID=UPI0019D2563D|nr:TIGR02452 family protein [Ligilactobacillus pobuzihii]MBN7273716.1 TIGR02452 family protein [Ligilactobacillus pobuzihii]
MAKEVAGTDNYTTELIKYRKALGHKAMNLYQIEMNNLQQDSMLIVSRQDESSPLGVNSPKIKVRAENVLYRIARVSDHRSLGVMNFADPIEPGGRFQDGINAQEQTLCRNSFLYPELLKFKQTYYADNKRNDNGFYYSRSLIYSHHVKVLRDEKEEGLANHYKYPDIVSISAPNIVAMKQEGLPVSNQHVEIDLFDKILRTLRAFKNERVRNLILGAFGCGTFQNDPQLTAQLFKDILSRKEFLGAFDEVYFDIYDDPETLEIYRKVLTANEK